MLCTSCQAELDPVMVVCPGCGVPLQKARETLDWRKQVRETVERHRAKKKRDNELSCELPQMSIFPETDGVDEQERLARQRRAEIRARVERKLGRTPPAGRALSRPVVRSRERRPYQSRPLASTVPSRAAEAAHSQAAVLDVPVVEESIAGRPMRARESQRSGDLARDPKTMEFKPIRKQQRSLEFDVIEPAESSGGETLFVDGAEQTSASSGEVGRPLVGSLPSVDPEPAAPVDTGEHVASRWSVVPAPAERFLAGAIDLGLVSLIQLTLFYLTTHLVSQRLGALPNSAIVAMSMVGVVMGAGYFLFFWALSGQTLGKLLTGSRVVDQSGRPLGIKRSLLRLGGALVALAPLGVGLVGLWSDVERRGWHDRIAKSKVVRG